MCWPKQASTLSPGNVAPLQALLLLPLVLVCLH
jgi:hypothetical protein